MHDNITNRKNIFLLEASRNAQLICIVTNDNLVELWKLNSKNEYTIFNTFNYYKKINKIPVLPVKIIKKFNKVRGVSISEDAKTLVIFTNSGKINIYNIDIKKNGCELIDTISQMNNNDKIKKIFILPVCKKIVVVYDSNLKEIYCVKQNGVYVFSQSIKNEFDICLFLTFSSNEKYFIETNISNKNILYKVNDHGLYKEYFSFNIENKKLINSLFLPENRYTIFVSYAGDIYLYSISKKKIVQKITYEKKRILDICLSNDYTQILVLYNDNTFYEYTFHNEVLIKKSQKFALDKLPILVTKSLIITSKKIIALSSSFSKHELTFCNFTDSKINTYGKAILKIVKNNTLRE